MNKVLITGATSGLGLAIAEEFLAAGKTVYLHGRSPDNIQTLLAATDRCHFFRNDLRDFGKLKEIAELVRREEIDCFVNNAGIYSDLGVTISTERCMDVLTTNLVAPVVIIKDVYEYYKSRRAGTIVSINSIAGLNPNFSEAVYCASKHGLSGFIKSLQSDSYRHNVRIFDYYPGALQTRLTRLREGFEGFIKPEDIADLIVSNVLNVQSFIAVSQELRKMPAV